MKDFIVSARKYRPTTFDSVVGQSSIILTLRNAIKLNQLAQSFLFCGPRGVGKTSCARILAKTINCENISSNIEPCDKCVSCTSFNDNSSFNVHELDAASNNSVDDIRQLVDQVRFAPQIGKYSIYIIDEVHMLSISAFNAFLKTLEEPPKHAKFILATTEKHKIIPTILSRCQIFDFKRVSVNDIANHLDFVAKSEGVTADTEALHLIAQKADGAMRDSLSLFDRLVSFSDKTLTYQNVIEHLNVLDYDYYFKVTHFLLQNGIYKLLNIYNEILDNGFDGHHFINGLADHFRDLLVSKDKETIQLLDKGDGLKKRYLEQSQLCDVSFLLDALDLCNGCDIQYKTTNNQRLLVEFTLMRISSLGFREDQKKKSKNFIVSVNDSTREVSVDKKEENDNREKKAVEDCSNVTLNLGSKKRSTLFSINTSVNKEEENDKSKKGSLVYRDKKFSQIELLKHWRDFILFAKEQGKSNLAIALGVHEPVLLEGFVVECPLINTAQQEIILEEKYMILDYLRNKLENDKIEIITKIVQVERSNMPYTNKDKFRRMLDQNKHLETLRIHLSLDPDY